MFLIMKNQTEKYIRKALENFKMILFVGICLGGKVPLHCGGRDGNGRLRMASGLEFRGVSSPAGKRDFNLSVALRQKKKQCSEN